VLVCDSLYQNVQVVNFKKKAVVVIPGRRMGSSLRLAEVIAQSRYGKFNLGSSFTSCQVIRLGVATFLSSYCYVFGNHTPPQTLLVQIKRRGV
jgi:hypothetical protein